MVCRVSWWVGWRVEHCFRWQAGGKWHGICSGCPAPTCSLCAQHESACFLCACACPLQELEALRGAPLSHSPMHSTSRATCCLWGTFQRPPLLQPPFCMHHGAHNWPLLAKARLGQARAQAPAAIRSLRIAVAAASPLPMRCAPCMRSRRLSPPRSHGPAAMQA